MRYGANAYGIQVHPEITTPMIKLWGGTCRPQAGAANAQAGGAYFEGRAVMTERLTGGRF